MKVVAKKEFRVNVIAYWIVALGALFYFYEYFLRITPSVIQPELMASFHMDATQFGQLSAFYFYAYTPMQLVVGLLIDRFKLRNILSMATFSCVLGTYLISATNHYSVAEFGRFLQGFGSAFAFVGALKLAAMWLPVRRFGFFSGACAALGFFGAACGQMLLTTFVEHSGWHAVLRLFAFAGILLMIALFFCVRENKNSICHSPNIKLSFNDFFSQIIAIIKLPRLWVAGILSALMFMPTTVFAGLWGIPYLCKLHDYTRVQAGVASAMIFLGWAVGAPLQGYISDLLQSRVRVIMVGAFIGAILSTVVLYDASLSYVTVCALFFFFGIASSSQVLTFAVARDLSSAAIAGSAIAFVNTLAMVGGFVFQRGVGQVLDWNWTGEMLHGERVYSLLSYEKSVAIIPVFLCLAFVIALCFRHKK